MYTIEFMKFTAATFDMELFKHQVSFNFTLTITSNSASLLFMSSLKKKRPINVRLIAQIIWFFNFFRVFPNASIERSLTLFWYYFSFHSQLSATLLQIPPKWALLYVVLLLCFCVNSVLEKSKKPVVKKLCSFYALPFRLIEQHFSLFHQRILQSTYQPIDLFCDSNRLFKLVCVSRYACHRACFITSFCTFCWFVNFRFFLPWK